MNIEKLQEANVPEKLWEECYISEDGIVFQPTVSIDGTIEKTAQEIYEEYLHPSPPEPSPIDVLGTQVAQLTIDNMQKDQIINALGEQLAQTSLDVMTMKGGV